MILVKIPPDKGKTQTYSAHHQGVHLMTVPEGKRCCCLGKEFISHKLNRQKNMPNTIIKN
jgi:hypothetical protein